MKRKDFIKNTLIGMGLMGIGPIRSFSKNENIQQNFPLSIVGFNHLPPQKQIKTKSMILHTSDSRGYANHGWLESRFSFSFAGYYNPERMHFGALRVLNDDIIEGGSGFGMHPHDNMEIISIPIEGALEHKDTMGNASVIQDTEVQVMSAGTGVYHSEFNALKDKKSKFLQIWVFPKFKNVSPRYGQMKFDVKGRKNKFQLIVSPDTNAKDHLWIHQDAWFHLFEPDKGIEETYTFKGANNGLYLFLMEGKVQINEQVLNKRDACGIQTTEDVKIKALENSKLLLIEVPLF
jgi:redox-sensitive bicupin YhaK (pirin superfamily)